MKNEKVIKPNNEIKGKMQMGPVTSPIPTDLVSKVNSLTLNKPNSSNGIIFDKTKILDYKMVVDELIKLLPIENLNDFYSKIY